jgi:hypothetical protein
MPANPAPMPGTTHRVSLFEQQRKIGRRPDRDDMHPSRHGLLKFLIPTLGLLASCGGTGGGGFQGGALQGPDAGEASSSAGSTTSAGGSGGGATGVCGAQPCSGCCDTSLTCQTGALDTACGVGAGACQDCTQTGQTCQAGACGGLGSSSGVGGSSGVGSSGGGTSGGGGSNYCATHPAVCGGGSGSGSGGGSRSRDGG